MWTVDTLCLLCDAFSVGSRDITSDFDRDPVSVDSPRRVQRWFRAENQMRREGISSVPRRVSLVCRSGFVIAAVTLCAPNAAAPFDAKIFLCSAQGHLGRL